MSELKAGEEKKVNLLFPSYLSTIEQDIHLESERIRQATGIL